MARTLSVKIPTSKLIADVEASIAKIDADIEAYAGLRKQYEADLAQWKTELISHAIKALQDSGNIGTDHNSLVRLNINNYRNDVDVSFDVDGLGFPAKPVEPTKPNEKSYFGRDYTTRKEILEKNLRILKMTNQEEVSASSYSSVIDLI
jgi:hypothetical protein